MTDSSSAEKRSVDKDEREKELENVAEELKRKEGIKRTWVYRGGTGDIQMVVGCAEEELPNEVERIIERNHLEPAKTEKVKNSYDHILVDKLSGREERRKENELLRDIKEEWGLENIGIGKFEELYEELGIDIGYVSPRILETGEKHVAEFEDGNRRVLQYTPDPAERRDMGAVFVSSEDGSRLDGDYEYEELIETYHAVIYGDLSEQKECVGCGRGFGVLEIESEDTKERMERWEESYCGC